MKSSLARKPVIRKPGDVFGMGAIFIVCIVCFNLFPLFTLGTSTSALDNIWKSLIIPFVMLFAVYKTRSRPRTRKSYIVFFLLLLMYQFLNPMINGDFPTNIKDLASLLFLPITYLLFFVTLGTQKMDGDQMTKFFKRFIIFALILCALNLVINYSQLRSLSLVIRPYDINFASIFPNRNIFGYYLYMAAAVNMYVLAKERKYLLYRISFVIILTNLLLTLSRTSLVAFVIFLITYSVLSGGYKTLAKWLIYAVIISTIVLSSAPVINFVNVNFIRKEAGLSGRDIAYDYSGELLINSNGLTGVGYFKSLEKLQERTGLYHFHDTYLTIFMYGGISLTLIYLVAIGFSLKKSFLIMKYDKKIGAFFVASLISYLAYSITESLPIFTPTANGFIATIFVILLPLYVANSYVYPVNKRRILED